MQPRECTFARAWRDSCNRSRDSMMRIPNISLFVTAAPADEVIQT